MCSAIRWLLLIGSVVLFTACGGGGGEEGSNPVSSNENGSEITGSGDSVSSNTEVADNADDTTTDRNQIDESTGFKKPVLEFLWSDDIAMGQGRIIDDTIMFSGVSEPNQIVEIWLNGKFSGSALANDIGAWRFDYRTRPLAVGEYFARLVSKSKDGTRTASAEAFHFVYDPSVPDVPLIETVIDDSNLPGDGYTSDTTLMFGGTAQFGVTVRVFLDGVEVGSVLADGNSQWTLDYTAVSLTDSNYEVTAQAEIFGLVSSVSQPFQLNVDTINPASPTLSGILPDSGASASDLITNQSAAILSGNAEPLASIAIQMNGVVAGQVSSNVSGVWSFDLSPLVLADGNHLVAMEAIDRAGNASGWSTVNTLVIDTIAPASASNILLSPNTGITTDSITAASGLSFSGMAESNTTVELFIGGGSIGSTAVDGFGNWSLDYSSISLAEGNYVLRSAVTDSAGNTSNQTNGLNFTVDFTPPMVPVNFSFSSDSGIVGDGITNDVDLDFSGTAEANSRVELLWQGSNVATVFANGSGSWSYHYAPANLGDGVYTLTARASDAAGNLSALSAGFNITIDTTAPAAPSVTGFSDDSGTIGDALTADNQLLFSGLAEAGATVELFINGASLGTSLADVSGNWTYDHTASVLSDGSYTLTSQATDAAGNSSALSADFVITVDSSTPAAPVMTNISDDTAMAGDGITSDNTLLIGGTAEANAGVEVFLNGISIGTTTANGSGVWSYDHSSVSLSDANYTLTAQATDQAGNVSAISAGFPITVDSAAPASPAVTAITNDTGAAADGITSDNQLLISGTAEANALVEVFLNGISIGSTSANGSGNWSFDHSGTTLADASYSLTAQASDPAGNQSLTSSGFSIRVDTSAPAAPAVTSISDDTATAGDGITSDNTLLVGGSAEANAEVEVFLNGVSIGTTTANGSGVWSYDHSSVSLTDANYTLTAQATDQAGNVSAISTGFLVTVDSAAPSTPAISAITDDTGTATDGITRDNQLLISGTAEANALVEVFIDSVSIGTTSANGSGNWSFDHTATTLADATYSLTAQASDSAGNLSLSSSGFSIRVDTSAPAAPAVTSISDDTATAGDGITSDNTLLIDGTAEASAGVDVFLNGVSIGTTTANGSGVWSYDHSSVSLSDANYSLTAQATDQAGNLSSISPDFSITVDSAAPSTPAVTAITNDTGTPSDGITSDNQLLISGTAEANASVEVFINSVSIGSTSADGIGNWSFDHSGTTLADATYSLTVQAMDASGNSSSVSAGFSITVDSAAPSTPAVTAITNDTGTPSDGITSDNQLLISGTAEANASVEVFIDSISIGTTSANGSGNWSFDHTATTLADATYSLTARAMDASGNLSASSTGFSITVDSAAPSTPAVTAITNDTGTPSDGITNDNQLLISGTAEANASVEVFINSISIGTTSADGSGNWSFDHTATTLADASYDLSAQATDAAGNQSLVSVAFTISVDTSIPAVPQVTAISDDTGTPADNITSDNRLVVSGTSVVNITIEVFLDGASIGTTTADGSGNWVLDYSAIAVADGAHDFTARALDNAANTSALSSALNFTVDTDDPDIATLVPANGVSSVSYTSNLTLTFDEVVYENSGNLTLRYVSNDAAVESVDITSTQVTGASSTTLVIDPSSVFYGGTQYYVELDSNTYSDLAGNGFAGISGSSIWSFTTEDTAVSSSTPADDATNIALNTALTLNFNEAVSVNTGNVRVRQVSNNATVDTIAITSGQVSGSGSSTIVVTLSDVLAPNTAYYIEIDSGAVVNGNNVNFPGITGNTTLNFTTVNVSVPTVTNVTSSLANGNYNGNDTIPIQVVFSEVVNVTGTPQLYIDLNGSDKYVSYVSGSGSTTLQFDYLVTTGDSKTDLNYVSTSSLILNGGSIISDNYANATLTLPAPAAAGSLGSNKNINIVAAALDLTAMTSGDGFIIQGYESSDEFGRAVGGTGDVNGDGYEDFIIGNELSDVGAADAGIAYLVYGKAGTTRSNINMSTFSATDGITISRGVIWENVGTSVFIGGDLNGDGYDEIIVTNPGDDTSSVSDSGKLYVIWGKPTLSNINMSTFSSADGFTIQGYEDSDYLGKHKGDYLDNNQFFDSEGDFNGDGIDDLLIGHSQSDEGGTDSGVAYLIFGKTGATRSNIILNSLGSDGFSITVDTGTDSYFGHSVEFVEDFNGDGYNDILIGAPHNPNLSSSGGDAYVIFGHGGPTFNTIDMGALTSSEGFQISVNDGDNWMGGSVSSADVNGDGLSDLLIAHAGDGGSVGAFAVLYGHVAATYANIGWNTISGTNGYYILGEGVADYFAHALEAVGDINGDGISDMLATSWTDIEGGGYAGAAWVVYGKAGTARSNVNLNSLTSNNGFKIIGDYGFGSSGDEFGKSIAVGDTNGDGYDDLIISAPKGDNGGSNAGEVYVIWGKDFLSTVTAGSTGNASANNLVGTNGDDILAGNGGADNFAAGSGNDTMEVSDLSFARINGGRGTNTLALTGSGLNLDLRTLYAERINGIEIINLNNNGNGLTLNRLSLLMLSEEVRSLYVKGGNSDFVVTDASETWTANGTVVVDSVTYNRYDLGEVSLYVQTSLSQPVTPGTPSVVSVSDDSGSQTNDQITSDNTLIFNGTSDAYNSVEVFIDGGSIGTTSADGAGDWSFDHTGSVLSDATYSVTSRATNLGGYTSALSSALTVMVDSFNPVAPAVSTITVDTATTADGVTSDNTLLINGSAEANTAIEVFVDSASIGTTTANGSGNWSFDYTGTALSDATYSITAESTDLAGNTSVASAAFAITIDTAAPTAPVVATINSDTGTLADGITSDNTLEILGTAEPNASVEVFIDASSIGTTTAGGGGIWSFDHTGTSLADGDYIITARTTDAAGNTSSLSVDFDITVDTGSPAAPVVTAITDDSGNGSDGTTNDNTLIFSGTAEANASVEVFLDASSVGTVTANGSGTWSFNHTATTLSDGDYILTAQTTDNAGNTSALSADFNITVDTSAPGINSLVPANAATSVSFTSNLTLTFDEVVYENSGNLTLRYVADDTAVESVDITGTQVTGTGSNTIVIDPTSMLYGGTQYYVELDSNTYTDLAGNNFAGISGNSVWAFTTTATAISSSTPADNATGVALNTSLTLNFNESVTVNSGNILIRKVSDNTTVDTIAITSGQVSGSGSSTIVVSLSDVLNPNTAYYVEIASGALRNGNNVSFAGISGNSTLNFTTANVSVPTVTNVTSSIANGNYRGSDIIPIQVVFSEIVNVTGTPQLYIDLDGSDKYINYSSGSGSTTLQFDYVVATGDVKTDLAYVSTSALGLNGGTIRSANYANATLTLPAPGAANSLSGNKNINITAAALDISNLTSSDGFFIEGSEALTVWFGHSISSGGDFNGDGFEDLVIGVPDSNLSNTSGGYAYLVYGKAGATRSAINMSSFSASDGFTVGGSDTADYLGSVVDISGDLNGDGYDDFVVVSSRQNSGASDAGAVYIIWGNASPGNINVSSDFNTTVGVSNSKGFVVLGSESADEIGHYSTIDPQNAQFVDASGDFNGDGIQDLLLGHNQSDFGSQTNAGVAYLIFGKTGATRANFKLDTYASEGFAFYNTSSSDNYVGHSVQYIGDFNGDGYNDVIIGAPQADGGATDSGEAYVVFGNPGPSFTDVDLNALNGTNGFTITTSASSSQLGGSVSSADINGDGLSDVLIGVPQADTVSNTNNGAAIILYGNTSGSYSNVTLEAVGSAGFVINGENDTDRSGHSIRGVKDINGDGIDDIVMSTIHDDEGGTSAGAAWIIYGKAGTSRSDINLSTLSSSDGFKIIGDQTGDEFGRSATSGDFNGDGYTDMMFSSVAGDNNGGHAGEINVIWGKDFAATVFAGSTGNSSANHMVGTSSNDTLTGNGGADTMSTGSGDDTLLFSDLAFSRARGGQGTDTLSLTNSSTDVDLRTINHDRIDGVEIIDLGNNGNRLLTDRISVLKLSSEVRTLYVKGGNNAAVIFDGAESWSANGTVAVNSITYHQYDLDKVSVFVQQGMSLPETPSAPTVDSISTDTGTPNDAITSDSTLVFSGTSGALYSVEVFIGGSSIGTTTANASGNWSYDHSAVTLSDATYSVTAQATNLGGYASAVSSALTVTVDGADPSAPTVSGISTDTGSSSSDGVTSDTTLSIAGTSEANATLSLFINSVAIGSTTADGSGNWTYDHSAVTLSEGSYAITATASDAAGNSSAVSTALNITIDTTAPTVSGLSPADNTTIGTANANLVITFDSVVQIGSGNITIRKQSDNSLFEQIPVGDARVTGAGTNTITINPTASMINGTGYYVQIASTAFTDVAGNNYAGISDNTSWNFAYETLNLTSHTPVDNSSNIAVTTKITLTFNIAASANTGYVTIRKSSDNSVFESIAVGSTQVTGNGTTTLTVTPYDVFEPNTSYYVEIDAGAFVSSGGSSFAGISGTSTFNFTTEVYPKPTVTSVTSTTSNGTYGAGSTINVRVNFSQLVYVTAGTPQLLLNLDGYDALIDYVSGSGSISLDFTYTVQLGDKTADLDYVATDALSRNGGFIRSGQSINADLTLPAPAGTGSLGSNKNIVIAASDLNISSILAGSSYGFAVTGNTASARLGQAVSNAGDVNGDGFEDLIAGAPNANDGTTYVIWGKAGATRSNIDLASFSSSDGFIIYGEADTSATIDNNLGISVGGVGDLNGDGYDEILVTASGNDNSQANDAGTAYIIWGKAGTTRANINTASFSSSDGFRIMSAEATSRLGYSTNGEAIASGGDFNGDGLQDLIIGHTDSAINIGAGGQAYLIFGKSGSTRDDIILDKTLIGSDGFFIGTSTAQALGQGVNFVGDFNGDGYDDIAIGAELNDVGSVDAGMAYVIFGNRGPIFPDLNVNTLSNTKMLSIYSSENSAKLGHSISYGDVNGDGLSDLLISANDKDFSSRLNSGAVYVIYGYNSGGSYPALEVETMLSSRGYAIYGDTSDKTGSAVAGVGDFNADGIDDILVTAYQDTNTGSSSGSAWIVYGLEGTTRANLDLASITSLDGIKFKSTVAGDYFGYSASQGDINGDGFSDLLIGAHFSDPSAINQAGEVFAIWGYDVAGSVVSLTGDANNNNIVGTSGSDTISGGGGVDAISAGSGDDTILVGDTSLFRINGGRGEDTLSFTTSGNALDISALNPMTINSVEIIDLADSGNTLTLSRGSVRALSQQTNKLYVKGGSSDAVMSSSGDAWIYADTQNIGGTDYDIYLDEGVELYIQTAVDSSAVESFSSTQTYTFDTTSSGANVAADVTDFPVLLRLSASIVSQLQGDFDDIRFIDDDKATLLPYEYELGASGELYVWVLVPQIDGDSNLDSIVMHYNDKVDGSVPDGQNAAKLWKDYSGVWHFDEAAAGTAYDSSRNQNNATEMSAGTVPLNSNKLIGNGRMFTNSILRVADHHSLDVDLKPFTIEFWVKERALTGVASTANVLLNRGTSTDFWRFDGKSGTTSSPVAPVMIMAEGGATTTQSLQSGNPSIANSVWVQMMAVYDPVGDTLTTYADGVQQGPVGTGRNVENGLPFNMGSTNANHQMDEVRYGRYVADANRVKLNYENQKAGSSLVSPQF